MKFLNLRLKINGEEKIIRVGSRERLLDLLRRLGYKSVKEGCSTGDCGSCNVLVDGVLVNSCLMLAIQARNREITTVEGFVTGRKLHPLQESFLEFAASQCGYCIPGILVTAEYLLSINPNPSEEEIRRILVGNICRCGGYTKIVEAIRTASLLSRERR